MKLIMHTAISIESMWWKFAMHEMENGWYDGAAAAPPSLVLYECSLFEKKKHATQVHTERDCCVN